MAIMASIPQRKVAYETCDPVCCCTVDLRGPSVEYIYWLGALYFFCSEICRKRFQKNPAEFKVWVF